MDRSPDMRVGVLWALDGEGASKGRSMGMGGAAKYGNIGGAKPGRPGIIMKGFMLGPKERRMSLTRNAHVSTNHKRVA